MSVYAGWPCLWVLAFCACFNHFNKLKRNFSIEPVICNMSPIVSKGPLSGEQLKGLGSPSSHLKWDNWSWMVEISGLNKYRRVDSSGQLIGWGVDSSGHLTHLKVDSSGHLIGWGVVRSGQITSRWSGREVADENKFTVGKQYLFFFEQTWHETHPSKFYALISIWTVQNSWPAKFLFNIDCNLMVNILSVLEFDIQSLISAIVTLPNVTVIIVRSIWETLFKSTCSSILFKFKIFVDFIPIK